MTDRKMTAYQGFAGIMAGIDPELFGPASVQCDQCGENPATTAEWGPNLCDRCATHTAMGDGGMGDA